jgi:putative N6-adenine-specific DNA methylase
MPEFDARRWQTLRRQMDAEIRPVPADLLHGSDCDPAAIRATEQNDALLPGGRRIQTRCTPFQKIEAIEHAMILCNPPYGIRLGNRDQTAVLLAEFGDFLKQRCGGCTAWIYFGDRSLIKALGLKPGTRIPIRSGGLDGCLCGYELYAGSRHDRRARSAGADPAL